MRKFCLAQSLSLIAVRALSAFQANALVVLDVADYGQTLQAEQRVKNARDADRHTTPSGIPWPVYVVYADFATANPNLFGVTKQYGGWGPDKLMVLYSQSIRNYTDDGSDAQRDNLLARVMAHELGHYIANMEHDDIDTQHLPGCIMAKENALDSYQAMISQRFCATFCMTSFRDKLPRGVEVLGDEARGGETE